MAGDNNSGSGHACDNAQGMEVLQASLLTQEMTLRALADSLDRIFQVLEGRFDEITDQLDDLALGSNRGRNKDKRRLRDDVAEGQPINRLVPAHHYRQPIYSDDSEEEEDYLFANHMPTRGSGRHACDYEKDSVDFKLKVDIPFFSGNLNVENFINWIEDIDKFFDYMEVLEEKRARPVACRLKGGASA